MMKKKPWLLPLLLLTVICLFLTACNGGTQDTTEEQPSEGQTSDQPSGATYQAQTDKILRISQSDAPNIDPGVGSDYSSCMAYVNLYDTLVYPTLEGEMAPMLATEWTTSDNGLEWTFTLRQDALFHDGTPVTASDVIFSLNRIMTMGEGFGFLFNNYVASAEAPDDYTVKFTLSKAFAPFLTILSRLYVLNEELVMANLADGAYGEMKDYGKAYLTDHDAGSGAYMIKEMRKQDRMIATAFADYWGEFAANAPQTIEIVGGTQTATIRTLMTNAELEISDQWQTEEAYQALDQLPDVDMTEMFVGSVLYAMINNTKAPMDDIHVRKAIAYMLDYEMIVTKLFPGCMAAKSPVPYGLPGYTDQITQYEYNMEKAAEELAQSKYADTIGDYEINVAWISEVPDEEKIALLIQSVGQELGLNVVVEKTPWLTHVENVAKQETTPCISMTFVTPDYNEAGSMLFLRFHSSTTGTWQQTEWLNDATLDGMIEDALVTLDQEARFQKYAEIQQYVADLCVCINVFNQAEKHAYYNFIDWPAADAAAAGAPVSLVMGYNYMFKDFSIN